MNDMTQTWVCLLRSSQAVPSRLTARGHCRPSVLIRSVQLEIPDLLAQVFRHLVVWDRDIDRIELSSDAQLWLSK